MVSTQCVFGHNDIYPPHHTHAATSHAISAAFKNSINTSCRQTRTSFTKLCLRNWTPVWNDFLFSYKKRLFLFQIAHLIGSFNISGRNFTAWIRGRHHGGRERTCPGVLSDLRPQSTVSVSSSGSWLETWHVSFCSRLSESEALLLLFFIFIFPLS